METVYVIQNPDREAVAATYEQSVAIEMCQTLNETKKGHTYRLIPFFNNGTTKITVISNAKITDL